MRYAVVTRCFGTGDATRPPEASEDIGTCPVFAAPFRHQAFAHRGRGVWSGIASVRSRIAKSIGLLNARDVTVPAPDVVDRCRDVGHRVVDPVGRARLVVLGERPWNHLGVAVRPVGRSPEYEGHQVRSVADPRAPAPRRAPARSHACSANARAVASPAATLELFEKRTELLAIAPGWRHSTANPAHGAELGQ